MSRTHANHLVDLVEEKDETKSEHLANNFIIFHRALLVNSDVGVRTQLDHCVNTKLPLGMPLLSL